MSFKKMTILFVSHSANLNGAERSLLTLVIKLNDLGKFRPIVLVPKSGSLTAELQKNKIKVFQINYQHWNGKSFLNRLFKGFPRFLINIFQAFKLRKLIKEIQPEIIYCNTAASPFGAILSILYHIPCIWHVREFIHKDMGLAFDIGRTLALYLINKSEIIICNSQAMQKEWGKYLIKNKIVVIYNGFDFPIKQGDPLEKYNKCVVNSKPILLIMVGSISPNKGQIDAINAIPLLLLKGYDVQLSLIGNGRPEYLSEVKALTKTIGIDDRVKWEGVTLNTGDFYQEAAVTLVCSRFEAFGRVAVESMGYGTPVVVSNTGGLPEIVDKGAIGLIFESGDYNKLAEQIDKLLLDQQLYISNSAKGRKSVIERFNIEQYALGIESLLLGILRK